MYSLPQKVMIMEVDMRGSKFKFIFVLISIILTFVLISYTSGATRKVTLFENIISRLTILPQDGFVYLKKWISNDSSFFNQIDDLEELNEELRKENEELKALLADYEVVKASNEILKEETKLANSYPDYDVVIANIIADSSSNWEEVYVINKGERDGVLPNMAVICTNGLVGYVESTTTSTAKVVSILDAGNAVSARSTRTRDAVVCKGNISLKDNEQLKISSIPFGVELLEGDKIETSGMGGRYPKGIAIGEVVSFVTKKNPTENEAIVQTYVDFNKLETVAVIVERSDE